VQKKQLGSSDLKITPIGVGAWAMGGGGWQWGWGPQDDQESVDAIHAALERGINWIDTAAVYGLGHSEEVVARALREWGGERPLVFTKCERTWNNKGEVGGTLKADSVQRECEASLRRLQVDVIDLYQIHWPQPEEDIEEGWAELAKLQQEGKVRYIGVSNFNVPQMKRAQQISPIISLQPPYSVLAREIEAEILPYAAQQNIGIIVYSPMYSGLLTGAMTRERIAKLPEDDWRKGSVNFQEPYLSRNLRLVRLLGCIGDRHGRTAGEVAIAWTLHAPAVTGAIVGVRNRKQVEGIVGAANFRLTEKEFEEIDAAQRMESCAAG
jgi:aryl-alcohol dehydrogenase-like predicted oxidoreductase